MSQPAEYVPQTDFQEEETDAVAGRSTVRTAMIDVEYDAIATTLSQVLANLAIIQRDDTALQDDIVTTESLSPQVRTLISTTGINPRGAWLTATSYAIKDVVETGTPVVSYICVTAHVSGTFATDRAAGKWMVLGNEPGSGMFTSITLTTGGITLGTVGTQDLASTGNRFRDGWFGRTVTAATSVVTPLVGTITTAQLGIQVNNAVTWVFQNTSNFIPATDNIQVIGGTGNRVATVFAPIIDSGTTGSLSLKTNNGTTQANIVHVASAVNTVDISGGATAGPVGIRATGSDAAVSLQFALKGGGSFTYRTDVLGTPADQFQILHTASSSRFITVTGSNGGNPTIGVTAGDLAITPNVVIAGTLTVSATSISVGSNPAQSGSLRISNAGSLRGRNAANSADVVMLTVDATNSVLLAGGGAFITWGTAMPALGGGAAPTFGTIGGSGPATAAQNKWLELIDNAGNHCWLPVWR